mmetsp:Transcript_36560/g.85391  ORF Transcript_36560/g.85391 Transcript_36560/m.85391 type:complete len:211 (+) Transcript_36560:194-826(+)
MCTSSTRMTHSAARPWRSQTLSTPPRRRCLASSPPLRAPPYPPPRLSRSASSTRLECPVWHRLCWGRWAGRQTRARPALPRPKWHAAQAGRTAHRPPVRAASSVATPAAASSMRQRTRSASTAASATTTGYGDWTRWLPMRGKCPSRHSTADGALARTSRKACEPIASSSRLLACHEVWWPGGSKLRWYLPLHSLEVKRSCDVIAQCASL